MTGHWKNAFYLFVLFLILGAGFVWAQDKELEVGIYPQVPGATAPTTTETPLPQYVKYIFNLLLALSGIFIFGLLIYGGFRYLTSTGIPSKLDEAKKQVLAAFLGLTIILSSYLILRTINPQLVILRLPTWIEVELPTFVQLPPQPAEKPTLLAEEIPIGIMINGAGFSSHKGVLDERRMDSIKEILGEVEKIFIKTIDLAKTLETLASQCSGSKTTCVAADLKAVCLCSGDPCGNVRAEMNRVRLEISALNYALDVFIKRDQKMRDFIANFPSVAVLERTLSSAEIENCNYVAASTCAQAYGGSGCVPSAKRSCMMGHLGISTLPADLQRDFERMAGIEEGGGELEQIKEEMEQELEFLEEGEEAMRRCPKIDENNKPFDLLFENELSLYREDLESNLKLIDGFNITKQWDIEVEDDPATFYCTEGVFEVEFIKEGEITAGDIQTQFQQIQQDIGRGKITCDPEIPMGETIDKAVVLAKNIIEAINELASSSSNQINSAFSINRLTDATNCTKEFDIQVGGASRRFCPKGTCSADKASYGKPCPDSPACPMPEIRNTLDGIKKNIACFLKRKGQRDVKLGGETLMCCDKNSYGSYACPSNIADLEGIFGRLLRYYEESKELNKQLADDRANLKICRNTVAERARITAGEDMPEKRVLPCDTVKPVCENLQEDYSCYKGAHPNYFCVEVPNDY